jgi:hypothetical protein
MGYILRLIDPGDALAVANCNFNSIDCTRVSFHPSSPIALSFSKRVTTVMLLHSSMMVLVEVVLDETILERGTKAVLLNDGY